MGDSSTACSISGLPITREQRVVGFGLVRSDFQDSIFEQQWLPASLPVRGFYDYAGGVCDDKQRNLLPGFEHVAVAHEKLWDGLNDFWNPVDGDRQAAKVFELLREKVSASRTYDADEMWERSLSWVSPSVCIKKSKLFWLLRILVGTPEEGVNEKEENGICSMRKAIIDLARHPETEGYEQACLDLDLLACAYYTHHVTGRNITSSRSVGVEQYPDYKRQYEWFCRVADLAGDLEKLER
jgi:hypothetical protein